ncbi:MAG: AAA family ATPase [Planctomycetota bacterium]|jgi:ABC-type branched-subunit amino acid transport system ATPase component
MISSLEITSFRGFKALSVDDLSRVNLFVGKNNSGKTTILEAADLAASEDSAAAIARCATRRGEMIIQRGERGAAKYADIAHLFHGHECEDGASFSIEGRENNVPISVYCEVIPSDTESQMGKRLFSDEDSLEPRSSLMIKHSSMDEPLIAPLSITGGLSQDYLRRPSPKSRPCSFVRPETLDTFELQEFWDSIALTEEESNVIEALRILEPTIDRIAFLSDRTYAGGIYVKLHGLENRIPMGTLGDGIRHLLTIALPLSRSRKGFVMIDEIDTGLHHSVMADMWRVLIETAKRLDVQVFATTHSLDCVRSLAWLYQRDPSLCHAVRLHRVDSTRDRTVVYGPDEIEMSAKEHVELRG